MNDQQQFRLNKISKVRDYFIREIKERELISKRLSKYLFFYYYSDKSLTVLSVTSGSISIASLDKLKTVLIDLSKLNNVVKNEVVKKLYDKLITKVNNIGTSGF